MYNDVKSLTKDVMDVSSLVKRVYQGTKVSLTELSGVTNITGTVWLDRIVAADDKIAEPLISSLHQMYMGYVLTALDLNQFVSASKTVSDVLQIISTEAMSPAVDVIECDITPDMLNMPVVSVESKVVKLDDESQRFVAARIVEIEIQVPKQSVAKYYADELKSKGETSEVGDTIDAGTVSLKVNLLIQLVPTVIDTSIAQQFIELNVNPGVLRRYRQWKAGEIGFMDFVFARDQVERYQQALKKDKDNVLYRMMTKQNNQLFHALKNMFTGNVSHNTANAILIVDKKSLDEAVHRAGFKMDNYADRQNFFKKAMMMGVCAVDGMYSTVDMYFNGIKTVGNYSYSMLQRVGKGKDGMDTKEVMRMFSQQSMPPRF